MRKNIMAVANENKMNVKQSVNGDIFTQEDTKVIEAEFVEIGDSIVKSMVPEIPPEAANDNLEAPKTPDEDAKEVEFIPPEVVIDLESIAVATGKSTKELVPMFSGPRAVEIPMEISSLKNFITVQEGVAKTAAALSKNMCLPPEQRSLFLEKAQLFAGLALKGQAQLGNAIRQIRTQKGYRSDLKKGKVDFDEVLAETRTKTDILKEDYNLGKGEARDLARLTNELVDEEIAYAIAHHDIPSRSHALRLLNRPKTLTPEEKAELDTEDAAKKSKFKGIEMERSTLEHDPTENKRWVKEDVPYCSLFSCIGSGERYLAQHGFVCKVACECSPERAAYFLAQYPGVDMVSDDFTKNIDVLVKKFQDNKCRLLLASPCCQPYCPMHGKDNVNDPAVSYFVYVILFIEKANPKWVMIENAKEFLSFNIKLIENWNDLPQDAIDEVKKYDTIGDYLKAKLEAFGYETTFVIEDGSFYGTAQARVRSITLASKTGKWLFPKRDKYAMPTFEAIGHLPSIEPGEVSPIPYHTPEPLVADDEIRTKHLMDCIAHIPEGGSACDNPEEFQISGFGFFPSKVSRNFWGRPSSTIDGGCGSYLSTRTLHPGRDIGNGLRSDCRPYTLKELFLLNGLGDNYKVPVGFEDKKNFIYKVMGEIMLPRFLERIIETLPLPDDMKPELE